VRCDASGRVSIIKTSESLSGGGRVDTSMKAEGGRVGSIDSAGGRGRDRLAVWLLGDCSSTSPDVGRCRIPCPPSLSAELRLNPLKSVSLDDPNSNSTSSPTVISNRPIPDLNDHERCRRRTSRPRTPPRNK
jgi:hypothetical protein